MRTLGELAKLPQHYSWRGRRPVADPRWYFGPDAISDVGTLVVGGASRSGTTLLRAVLDAHPEISCGPESSLFRGVFNETLLHRQYEFSRGDLRRFQREAGSFPQLVTRVLSEYARRNGKDKFAEKTPANVTNIGWILDRFPNSQFVHVVRDGRAVVNSLRTHPRFRFVKGEPVPTGIERDVDECITLWLSMVRRGLELAEHPRVAPLRYEDLVADPEGALTPILKRVGWTWRDEMARHHEADRPARIRFLGQNPGAFEPRNTDAIAKWQDELTPQQVARIEERGGDVLEELGYK